MIDWDKPIETVDGREARFIGPEPLASLPEARIVHVKDRKHAPLSCGDVFLVNDQGYRCDDRITYIGKRQEPFIRNVRVKREGWVNIYGVFKTEEEAKRASMDAHIGCQRFVRWEE